MKRFNAEIKTEYYHHRWVPAFFFTLSRSRSRSNKERESVKKEKRALFPLFAESHWKPGSRAQIHSAGGKARACPHCMSISMPHVQAACPCFMSMLDVLAACPCFMCMLHVHAAFPRYMGMARSHAVCPCCVFMPHVRATFSC
jgi:hypothetical protein